MRLVAVARGVATVQNAMVKRTVYTVDAAPRAPTTIYLRHQPTPGFAKLPGAEAAAPRRRLLTSLTATAARAENLAQRIAAGRARELAARVTLQTAIEALALEQLDGPAVATSATLQLVAPRP